MYQGAWRAGQRHGEGSHHCASLEAQYIGEWCAWQRWALLSSKAERHQLNGPPDSLMTSFCCAASSRPWHVRGEL